MMHSEGNVDVIGSSAGLFSAELNCIGATAWIAYMSYGAYLIK